LAAQANDENMVDENGNLVGESTPVQEEPVIPQGQSSIDMSIEKLRDFNYLLTNFYTVDSTTMIGPEQLNVDDLLGRNMKIDKSTKGAKVLIFHSHSQETFVDSVPGDASTSIVGVGEYLTQLLNQKGIETIHDTGVYDIINGQLDRSNAYENAEASVRPVLDANPTIEVAIDLHRDGVNQDTHLVTEVNGKPTARIMYFNGLSRTRMNGDIAYLNNPYIQDNLAFSLQMELASENKYPGFARRIYLAGYRYNLHLLPKSLLIEAGAQTNTVGEMMNAMEVLADVLSNVVTE
jgi:stage II sporulation protein P